jgi:hypothetical protein
MKFQTLGSFPGSIRVAQAGAVYVSNGPYQRGSNNSLFPECEEASRSGRIHCQRLSLATQGRFEHRYTDVPAQPSVTLPPCSFVQANSSTLQMDKHVPPETSSVQPPNCSLNSAPCRPRAQATLTDRQRGRVCKFGKHSQLLKRFQKGELS